MLSLVGGVAVDKEHMLQELMQEKRTYESLLAMNASGRHRSASVETMLKEHLARVAHALARYR
jgi:hypothetical protein